MNQLQEQINTVAQLRESLQKKMADYKTIKEAFDLSVKSITEDITQTSEFLNTAESALRELTITAYRETGSKSPAPGVGIREITRIEFDAKEAFLWASEHKIALKLDTSAFEKIAKASPLEFVTTSIIPQATIATDLSKYISEAK